MKIHEILESISSTYNFTNKEKVVFLNTSDILNGKVLRNEYTDSRILPGQAKKSIAYGDILFSEIRPKNKRFALISISNPTDYVVSTKLMVLRIVNQDFSPQYVYQFLTQEKTLEILQSAAESRSGTFPQITFTELGELEIPNISLPEQQHIVNPMYMLIFAV